MWFHFGYDFYSSCVKPIGWSYVKTCSVQLLSRVQLFATPWTAAHLPVHHQLPEFIQTHITESVMPSNHLMLCTSLSSCPQPFPASVFSNESVLCIRWPKYWSFSFSFSLSNQYSGLVSFRIDWFDLFAVQETQESSPAP